MRQVVPLREGYRAFTLFTQRLRRKKQSPILYIAVPEFQKRGAVHFHVLIWGLSDEEIIGERKTRELAQLWGQGFVDIRSTDGGDRLVGYLTKYMSKNLFDNRLRGQKAYTATRNLVRPVSLNSPFQVDSVKRIWSLGVDNLPLTEKQYQTKFMGKCNYSVYNIK